MTPDWLRPNAAAALFGVSADTLAAWAKRHRIGRSQPGGPRTTVLYRASDIQAVLDGAETPREQPQPTPIRADQPAIGVGWETTGIWAGRRPG